MKRRGPDSDTRDPSTDGLSHTQTGRARHFTDQATLAEWARQAQLDAYREAAVILIAHPDGKRLGSHFKLPPSGTLEIGRSPAAAISLPEVPSLSRSHARLRYGSGGRVTIEDLGSRNGTYVNDRAVRDVVELATGDRFQVGSVHFKFLHEQDVEHAYHEAIYQMVMRDGLTEAFNQRKFQEEGARELARAQRHERPLSLILFDIDHFKQVNDTHGHLAGDGVLKQLAARVQSLLRQEQTFARVGGEEFAVLSPETDLEGAATLAEKLRERFAATGFSCVGATVTITCSFGVAQVDSATARLDELVARADRALYRAKELGRNRVVSARD